MLGGAADVVTFALEMGPILSNRLFLSMRRLHRTQSASIIPVARKLLHIWMDKLSRAEVDDDIKGVRGLDGEPDCVR